MERSGPVLSVLMPVYNEEATVGAAIDRVAASPIRKELIVVDDGSTDGTAAVIRSRESAVHVFHESPVNAGKGSAIRVALTYARGDIVIIQDADLEYDPNDYERLVAPIRDGAADVVFGSRFVAGREARGVPVRYRSVFANGLITAVANVLYGVRLTDVMTGYKVFRRDVVLGLHLESRGFELETEIAAKVARLGHRLVEVPIGYVPRSETEGKKIRWHDTLPVLRALVRYRLAPRRALVVPAQGTATAPRS